jgi:hypothetical protein
MTPLNSSDRSLLQAAENCGNFSRQGFCKCALVLRSALEANGIMSDAAEYAVCNTGYENEDVARLYDGIRALIKSGLLEGRGDLGLPAGPRYTECRITAEGREILHSDEMPTR